MNIHCKAVREDNLVRAKAVHFPQALAKETRKEPGDFRFVIADCRLPIGRSLRLEVVSLE
jgi:hypothetical protein